ncbi:MAG: DUF2490 domain-containing protein [Bacteroidota bacterium]
MQRLILLLFVISSFSGYSQESDLGNWLIYIGSKKLNNKWNLHHEVQHRNYNAVGDLEQLLLRTGIGYNLSENNNNLLLGYGYILSQNYVGNSDEKVDINEHRIFQQFITKQQLGRISVQHRYRFEQRFVEDDFRLRFRYFLALAIPFTQKTMMDKTFYFSIYNELFINSVANQFDRNRLYAGIGYKLNKNIRLELGYMNQFISNVNRDQINIFTFANF